MPRLFPLLLAVTALADRPAWSATEDTVIYAAGKDARGRLTVTGTILDYTGERLLIRTDAGREQTIPTERVIELKTEWPAAHQEGDRLFAENEFALAADQYREALGAERRVWAERQILARCVRALHNAEDFGRAGELFLRLITSDRQTQHFGTIPLAWLPHPPSAGLQQQAAGWLANQREPVAQLLGASWLLDSARRSEAVAALARLAQDRDRRVAPLATAQAWRTRLAVATAEEVQGWAAAIERMRADLRAGPYLLLGHGYARLGRSEAAALALLRVPVLYPADRRLAATALLSAAQELERIGQQEEAAALRQERRQRYAELAK